MGLEMLASIGGIGAQWLWEKQGKALALKALGNIRQRWAAFQWGDAEVKYRSRLYEQYSHTHILGNPKNLVIEELFTDVYVLDKPTAFQRYNIEDLQKIPVLHDKVQISQKRRPVLRLAVNEKRLFILGKPGAGKTTLLKYLTLQACIGKIEKTPIFVSLKDWADSNMELLAFMALQFEICAFPDAKAFIELLLKKGKAIVLFDGLDEVNVEANQRMEMMRILTRFSKLYPDTQTLITCRVAAIDYSFENFTYLEIADFDKRQINLFLKKWYQTEPEKLEKFKTELSKPANRNIRELVKTPLLLTLVCLAFDETQTFPSRRADLYKEALDVLLKRWDSTRGISRDDTYRDLSLARKEQLLSWIATQNFEEGIYFIRQDRLVKQISRYLDQIQPIKDKDAAPDYEVVLKAIEAQHGILVERAHGIYSFSHLTFQEYFTARLIVDNEKHGTLETLIEEHFLEDRWREVFLLTASLLENAEKYINGLFNKTRRIVIDNNHCKHLLNWAYTEGFDYKDKSPAARYFLLFNAFISVLGRLPTSDLDFPGARARNKAIIQDLETCCLLSLAISLSLTYNVDVDLSMTRMKGYELSQGLSKDFGSKINKNIYKWHPTARDVSFMVRYLEANQLLVECLRLASQIDRRRKESKLLLLDLKN